MYNWGYNEKPIRVGSYESPPPEGINEMKIFFSGYSKRLIASRLLKAMIFLFAIASAFGFYLEPKLVLVWISLLLLGLVLVQALVAFQDRRSQRGADAIEAFLKDVQPQVPERLMIELGAHLKNPDFGDQSTAVGNRWYWHVHGMLEVHAFPYVSRYEAQGMQMMRGIAEVCQQISKDCDFLSEVVIELRNRPSGA